jgi:hypothetical protein
MSRSTPHPSALPDDDDDKHNKMAGEILASSARSGRYWIEGIAREAKAQERTRRSGRDDASSVRAQARK